jgi:hypothetical protein
MYSEIAISKVDNICSYAEIYVFQNQILSIFWEYFGKKRVNIRKSANMSLSHQRGLVQKFLNFARLPSFFMPNFRSYFWTTLKKNSLLKINLEIKILDFILILNKSLHIVLILIFKFF